METKSYSKTEAQKFSLDFGMSFALKKRYYSLPFLSPRSKKSLQELGILPKLEGSYRFDDKIAEVDAVFLSHAHMDHSAYISFVNREIPTYCGETTKIILQTLGEMRAAGLEFNVDDILFESFRAGDVITVDDLEIEPIHVDHSVPEAYDFIVHTSNGAVVYTGDFRAHGTKPEMTADFVAKAKEAEPAAVVTEATNMTGESISSEAEVKNKLNRIVGQTKEMRSIPKTRR